MMLFTRNNAVCEIPCWMITWQALTNFDLYQMKYLIDMNDLFDEKR